MHQNKNDPIALDSSSVMLDVRNYEKLIQELHVLRETEKKYENLIFHLKFWSSYVTISLLCGWLHKTDQPNSFLIGLGYGAMVAPFLIVFVQTLATKLIRILRRL